MIIIPPVFETKELRSLACRDRRDLPLQLCDLKFSGKADEPVKFEGYASVWGRQDSYGDTILKGAFTQALQERRPMMLYGHNPGRVIGKWTSLGEDDKGLKVDGELTPGHSDAQDCAASLKHGAMSGLSIGGYTDDAEYLQDGGRLIKVFDLYEISVVAMPAENEARIDSSSVKSTLDECVSLADMELMLRDLGFSRTMATAFSAKMRRIVREEKDSERRLNTVAEDLLRTIRGATTST